MTYGDELIAAPGTIHYEDGEGNDLFIGADGTKATVLTSGHDRADWVLDPPVRPVQSKVKRRADHLLHFKPSVHGGTWRLECLPHGEHFTADVEEWSGTADELEANGVKVDRSTCWVHDWLDNMDGDEWIKGDDWAEDGPWYVVCSYSGDGLDIEPAERVPPRVQITWGVPDGSA